MTLIVQQNLHIVEFYRHLKEGIKTIYVSSCRPLTNVSLKMNRTKIGSNIWQAMVLTGSIVCVNEHKTLVIHTTGVQSAPETDDGF
jgi:hypothetical protein